MKVYPPRDIRPFVMYCVNGKPRSSLLIESIDSMIIYIYKYSENSDNSTDKGGSLRSPIIYNIIESVDSISKDEGGFLLMQYITNGRISRGGYTFTHFKHHHRVLRLISYSMSV